MNIANIPTKAETCRMYPDQPQRKLRKRMADISEENGGSRHSNTQTPKEWQLLKDEIGDPTHDRYGKPLLDEAV